MRLGFIPLDFCNTARFIAPRMVNQDFSIHAKHLVKRIGMLDTCTCKVAHRKNTTPVIQVTMSKALRNATPQLPKARNRPMAP